MIYDIFYFSDKSLKVKAEYKNEVLAVNGDADFKTATPSLTFSGVFGYHGMLNRENIHLSFTFSFNFVSHLFTSFIGWLSGYQLKFDCKDSKLKNNNLALGYSTNEFVLHTNV